MAQVEAAAASAEAVTLLAQEETRRRSAEEKFVKMKDVYQKLRDEHISLIRGVSVCYVSENKNKIKNKFPYPVHP